MLKFVSLLVFLNRSSTKSQIPTPRSVSRIPRRPGSTTPGATPSSPATVKRAAHPPRAQSVDPYKMASQSLSSSSTSLLRSYNSAASKIKRPGSSRYVLAYIIVMEYSSRKEHSELRGYRQNECSYERDGIPDRNLKAFFM